MKITEITDENLATTSRDDLVSAVADAETALNEILELEDPTPEQIDQASALNDAIDKVNGQIVSLDAAEQARKDELAKMREQRDARKAAAEKAAAEPDEPEQPETDKVTEPEAVVDEPAPDADVVTEVEPEVVSEPAPQAVAASAREKLAGNRPAPVERTPAVQKLAPSLVASADNGLVAANADVTMLDAQRIMRRHFSAARGSTGRHAYPIASVRLQTDPRTHITERSSEHEVNEVLDFTSSFGRIREAKGLGSDVTDAQALTAAGWCAPSVQTYDFCPGGSREGLWESPEFTVERGGLKYTQGPDFAALYDTDFGWVITEAEADAETFDKVCVTIPCPDFVEARLDAVGFCVTSDLLPKAAYPELEAAFLAEALIAFDHKKANIQLGKALTAAGTAITAPNLGSVATSTLTAVALVAEGQRRSYRWPTSTVLEVVVPHWAREAFRADLANRNGVDKLAVTDAEIAQWFAVRNLNVQYIYDYPGFLLDAGVATMPTSMQALVYKAGTFETGVAPVINMSAIYDSTLLAENKYMAIFFEQGMLFLNRCHGAKRITIPVCAVGRTGLNDVTCA